MNKELVSVKFILSYTILHIKYNEFGDFKNYRSAKVIRQFIKLIIHLVALRLPLTLRF